MDCFLWKFLRTCLPFSSILLTLFFLMSLCRFKKTGIHLTTYLKCLTTPSCTRSNSPPKVWYQNHTKPVCSLSLWKYLRFQILALERIRSKQGHGAGSPGPINRCSGRWTALLRHQRSPTAWVHEAHVSHATAQGPVNIAWKCAAPPTQRGSHLFGYFPSSWDVREGSQLCVTLLFLFHGAIMTPTGEFQFTHPASRNAHIGSPYMKEKQACVGDSQKRGHSWEFLHTETDGCWDAVFNAPSTNPPGKKGYLSFSCSLCSWGRTGHLDLLVWAVVILGKQMKQWVRK